MPDNVYELFADYPKLTRPVFRRRWMALFGEDPDLPREAIELMFEESSLTRAFVATAAHSLPSSEFTALTDAAMAILRQNPSHQAAQAFIACASNQALSSLRPYLRDLFELQLQWTSHGAMLAWRESGTAEFEFLAKRAVKSRFFWNRDWTGKTYQAAIQALLQTREESCLRFVVPHLKPERLRAQLLAVGYELRGQEFHRLYSENSFHLAYPSDCFSGAGESAGWLPMEGLDDAGKSTQQAVFGGIGNGVCAACKRHLANLLSLDEIPVEVGLPSLARVSIEACLQCLETSYIFYQHDALGLPAELEREQLASPSVEEEPVVLKRAEVRLLTTPDRWRWQDWAMADDRENLNRLGGHPAWVQGPHYPSCPKCGLTMQHLLQLGGDMPTESGDLWTCVDGGCLYVAWCNSCSISEISLQFI